MKAMDNTKLKSEQSTPAEGWRSWRKEKKRQTREWRAQNLVKKMKKKDESAQKQLTSERDSEKNYKIRRNCTISIAVPGSILDNAQSRELKTYLVGQIARAAVIFNVDEIVVFDDTGSSSFNDDIETEMMNQNSSCSAMARILQYLECPQYLRKHLFTFHTDLQLVGLLNPLDIPHHLRESEDCQYREGVVTDKSKGEKGGSYIYVGQGNKDILVEKLLQPGLRVTVEILPTKGKKRKGKIVHPTTPTENGIYWGYNVRVAESLGAVFKRSPFEGGYDVTIGTSDKGIPVQEVQLDAFKHAIIVFGGLKGLEASLEADERLSEDDPRELFKYYVNSCVNQGSRTIRTEEAILITLASLQAKFNDT